MKAPTFTVQRSKRFSIWFTEKRGLLREKQTLLMYAFTFSHTGSQAMTKGISIVIFVVYAVVAALVRAGKWADFEVLARDHGSHGEAPTFKHPHSREIAKHFRC